VGLKGLSPWPFFFEGFDSLDAPVLLPDAGAPHHAWHGVLVRLWVDEPLRGARCPASSVPDGFADFAAQVAGARMRSLSAPVVLLDPTGELAGWTVEWEASDHYLGAALFAAGASLSEEADAAPR
jgi:hypothetical protein